MEFLFTDILRLYKQGLIVYLVAIGLMIVLYPILIFTVASQKRSHKKTIRSFEKELIRISKIDYNKELNCLLLVSVALWITILLYSPAIIFEARFPHSKYYSTSANPQSVTQIPRIVFLIEIGIQGVVENLILLATLLQTIRLQTNPKRRENHLKLRVKPNSQINFTQRVQTALSSEPQSDAMDEHNNQPQISNATETSSKGSNFLALENKRKLSPIPFEVQNYYLQPKSS
ncbi:expressed protein [Phakopsora pachyrhizi]|uniref:Expressed protein n=1 Tax=Phakopsora pachyrhizi TaxID=170000 RepID=A0AAV0B375_PHAPC|nr:expressed protein [Phakopsora pachyrhizi]